MRDIRSEIESLVRQLGGTVGVAVRGIMNALDFSYNEDERMYSASTIKIPVLVEAVRRLAEGSADLDREFVLPDDDRTPGSGVLRFMHGAMTLTYHDLMVLMIITSDNLATNLLIDFLTPEAITATMRGFGYRATEVQRRIFDYEAMGRGLYNWIAAGEIADLCKRIYTKTAVGGRWMSWRSGYWAGSWTRSACVCCCRTRPGSQTSQESRRRRCMTQASYGRMTSPTRYVWLQPAGRTGARRS